MEQPLSRISASAVDDQEVYLASQWKLMWWRFRRHKAALIASFFVVAVYVISLGVEFLATSDPSRADSRFILLLPQRIHIFDVSAVRPHVLGLKSERDPVTRERVYMTDPEVKIPISFWIKGFEYKFLGFIRTDRHLIGIEDNKDRPDMYILGTDIIGRDMFSRMMLAMRTSMSIGLIGIVLTFVFGILIGGISGYFGGTIDIFIQRVIEVLSSIPTLPLWIGLSMIFPLTWPSQQRYFAIVVILSVLGWTGLARVVRGRFLSLREEDFVMAAQLAGSSTGRVIFRHMLPSFTSHIIASLSLSIPSMILGETALSFLGLGLQSPAVSFGVMLQKAQNVETLALHPWLMLPALAVVIIVLSFNFMGDGLRDAADPYG